MQHIDVINGPALITIILTKVSWLCCPLQLWRRSTAACRLFSAFHTKQWAASSETQSASDGSPLVESRSKVFSRHVLHVSSRSFQDELEVWRLARPRDEAYCCSWRKRRRGGT